MFTQVYYKFIAAFKAKSSIFRHLNLLHRRQSNMAFLIDPAYLSVLNGIAYIRTCIAYMHKIYPIYVHNALHILGIYGSNVIANFHSINLSI